MEKLTWRVNEIIRHVKESSEFRILLINHAEPIIEDIYTFSDTGCGKCRKEILKYIENNRETINKIIELYEKDHTKLSNTPTSRRDRVTNEPDRTTRNKNNRVLGDVFEIEADPEAYKSLIQLSQKERWVFRGLNVVPKDDKWLIMFY